MEVVLLLEDSEAMGTVAKLLLAVGMEKDAIAHLRDVNQFIETKPKSQLIFFQTSNDLESALGKLKQILFCCPESAVLVVGEERDTSVMDRFICEGAREYLHVDDLNVTLIRSIMRHVRVWRSHDKMSYLNDLNSARAQLKEMELLRECIRSSNFSVIITKADPLDDPGPEIVYVNKAFERVTGFLKDEALGKSPRLLQGPETNRAVLNGIRQALESGHAAHKELINYRKDGAVFWNEIEINPIRNADGDLTHWVAFQRDITERKAIEKALRESNREIEDLRTAIDHHSIVAMTDKRGIITYANDKFCKISGYERKELIGQNHRILKSGHHPDSFYQVMWKTIANGAVWSGDIKNRAKDGTEYWVSTTIAPLLDESGKPESYIAIRHESTRLKLTEQRMAFQASLIENANNAILVLDNEGKIIFWNHGAELACGYSKEEVLGKYPASLLAIEENTWNEALKISRSTGRWSGELSCVDRQGRHHYFNSRWTSIPGSSDDQQESVLIINSDLTQQKALEKQVWRAQRVESVGHLAAGIAHDLNNMLAPIMLSVDNIRHAKTDDQREQSLILIEKSAERAASLVRQVLFFSRGIEGQKAEMSIGHVIQEIANIIRETFPKNINLIIDLSSDAHTITGNVTQIHQVIMNMCVNARDAMENGGNLTIKAYNHVLDETYAKMNFEAAPGPYLVICIIDDGVGIPANNMAKIFDPFFTTKGTGKGSGIGLSTSLAILKSHHGFIHAYSELGKGSTFKLYFPACLNSAVNEKSTDEHRNELFYGNGETILIVDDEPSILSVCESTLQRYGYKTITAKNGAEASAIYAKNEEIIDLVLTDMAMPIMDGYALIIALRAIRPDIKIIAASGLASNGRLGKALGAGVKHFVSKPYTSKTLLSTIRQALDEDAPLGDAGNE